MKIIKAIAAKLAVNAELVENGKSGRLNWWVTPKGVVKVTLQPDL